MMRLTILLAFMLLSSISLIGQTKITGEVVDEGDKKTKLTNATIMLLQAKDSILVDYARANDQGKFTLNRPDTGAFLLIVSYPKFGFFQQDIRGTTDINLGQLGLTSVAHLLEEVIVTGKIPIQIKGDTTEFNAASFAVEKNAKVEDLLKVLPGITVDAQGKITAQGKTVEKVLVDGEEFFGNDPTLVTRNLRSDMVDKVQLYEKKSEEAERTGVDDGTRIQTINLKLKENAKRGMFGKAEAGGGRDNKSNFYTGTAAFNRFAGKQKIGFFALGANDGTVSMNWEDKDKYGFSDISSEVGDDGSVNWSWTGGDDMDYWNGRGRPKAFSLGAFMSDSWKEGKHKLNVSYKVAHVENEEQSSKVSQESGKDIVLNSQERSEESKNNDKQKFNGRYDLKLDSLHTITFNLGMSKRKTRIESEKEASTYDHEYLLNDNNAKQNSESKNESLDYSVYFTRKFAKEGRSLSLRVNGEHGSGRGDGFLNATTNFYKLNLLDSVNKVDQRKEMETKKNSFRSVLSYSEPLSKRITSSLQYEYVSNKSSSLQNSYNRVSPDGDYTVLDKEFSNDFDFNTTRHAANLGLNYRSDKLRINLSQGLRSDKLSQINNNEQLEVQRSYLTYNPSFNLRWEMKKNNYLGMNFYRFNQLPNLSQVQPLKQNSDPLNIIVGNPNLKPSQSNTYELRHNTYNILKDRYTYVSLSWTQQFNSIRQNVVIADGVRTFAFSNLEDVGNNLRFYGGFGQDVWKKYKLKTYMQGSANYSNYSSYVNGDLSDNTSLNYSVSLGFNRNTKKSVDFDIEYRPGFSVLKNSLQPQLNSKGFTQDMNLYLSVFLPLKVKLYSEMNYTYQAPTDVFGEKFERMLWKPGITKKFLKNETLALDFYVQDVLNKNVGFSRRQSGSSLVQENYNTIGRYFMLKVSWDFNFMKGATNE